LSKHQKKEFKQLKSRLKKQNRRQRITMSASHIEGIQPNAWNWVFYPLSANDLLKLEEIIKANEPNNYPILLLNSDIHFFRWLDNTELTALGVLGGMNSQATYLFASGTWNEKVYPFAFMGLSKILHQFPPLKGCIQTLRDDGKILCRKDDSEKELVYAIFDPDKVYSRVNIRIAYFVEFMVLYMQMVEQDVLLDQ
jgi:hypothetical protein